MEEKNGKRHWWDEMNMNPSYYDPPRISSDGGGGWGTSSSYLTTGNKTMKDQKFFRPHTPTPEEGENEKEELTVAEINELKQKLMQSQYDSLKSMVDSPDLNAYHKRTRDELKVWEISHADTYKPKRGYN